MIDFKNLPFGTTLFQVYQRNNMLTRQKLEFTDSEGNTWYRYNEPILVYKIQKFIYCGYVESKAVGFVDKNDFDEKYDSFKPYFLDQNKILVQIDDTGDLFLTKEEADKYIVEELKNV